MGWFSTVLPPTVAGPQADVFGTGSLGDITISVSTTLADDMYYNNLTINNGVGVDTGGYKIFVKNTLTNNGTIYHNGLNCSGRIGAAGAATGTVGGGSSGGNGGGDQNTRGGGGGGGICFISAQIIINNGIISANGGNGAGASGQYLVGSGTAGIAITNALGGKGGNAGNTYVSNGGVGGAITMSTTPPTNIIFALCAQPGKIGLYTGGSGGGGGATGIYNSVSTATAGAGGGGGAVILIYRTKSGTGTVTVTGGATSGSTNSVASHSQPGANGNIYEFVA